MGKYSKTTKAKKGKSKGYCSAKPMKPAYSKNARRTTSR